MTDDPTHGHDWSPERSSVNRHFFRDVDNLWNEILRLAAIVEASLTHSIRVLCDGKAEYADQVRGEEREIDRREVFIERECLRILALYQPVASDLRRVVAVLKVNGDLERMGDLAMRIARRSRKLVRRGVVTEVGPQIEELAAEALGLVHDSLDALAKVDVELARGVLLGDRTINRHRTAILAELKRAIRREPERVTTWLRLINTTRNLERIADHATNIAESVVYLKEGEIIRHTHSSPPIQADESS